MPPMMPFLHDALWFGFFAGLALFAWKAAQRFDLRLSGFDWRQPFARAGDMAATPPSAWFTTTTRSSGNSAFEAFVDKLKRAKDRQTFERFMAEHGEGPTAAAAETDHLRV